MSEQGIRLPATADGNLTPRSEGLMLAVDPGLGAGAATRKARRVVAETLPGDWVVERLAYSGGLCQALRRRPSLQPIVARKILVAQTWQMVKMRPLTGVGFGHFADVQQEVARDPGSLAALTSGVLVEHNLFLNMWAETGTIGLILIVLVFVLLWRQSVRLRRRLPQTAAGWLCRDFVVLFWVLLANFLIESQFRDLLWDEFASAVFWSFAGLVVGFNRLLDPHPLDLPAGGPSA